MKDLSQILKKYSNWLLIPIFIIALTLRWWYLPGRNINFGYDQARDAFAIQEILSGHLKILGPPTSGTPGLFHGVLYYYIITPAYYFGHGDPLVVAYWMSFLSALTVLPVFYLTYLLTGKKAPSFIAALIFACSFDAIQFSNFISNVGLGVLFVPLIYVGILLWVKKLTKWAAAFTGIALGLAVQSEIAFYFYLIPVIIWLVIYKSKISKKEIFWFVLTFVITISTMLVCELKFNFPGIKGLYYLFSSQDATARNKQFSDFLAVFMNQSGDRFANTLFPFNMAFGGLMGFGMMAYSLLKKSGKKIDGAPTWPSFLALYIPAHIIALPFGGSITPYIMIGAIPAICILVAIFLWEEVGKRKIILILALILLLSVNLFKFVKQNNSTHPDYFTNDYLLSTEMKIVDYTYEESGNEPFSISTLTTPLYINVLWSYLYNWHGMEKYGKLPYWIGHDQIGQLGNNLLPPPDGVKKHFFIAEPAYLIPQPYEIYAEGDQNLISVLTKRLNFGNIVVERREKK